MSVEDRIGQAQADPEPGRPVSPGCAHRHNGRPATPESDLLADCAAVMAERGAQYGPPSDHHARTATAVNAILGLDLAPRDVALFFAIDKLVRARTSSGKRDSYLDAANYIAIAWGHQERSG